MLETIRRTVETRELMLAERRNIERFLDDFIFRLTDMEPAARPKRRIGFGRVDK